MSEKKKSESVFGEYIKTFEIEELKGFTPFIKFANFGDFVIGKFIKIETETIKGIGETKQMYLEVISSNIHTINAKTENAQTLETLEGMKIKFIIPTNVLIKIGSEDLKPNQSIIGIEKHKESDFERFGNPMIEYKVFVKNE